MSLPHSLHQRRPPEDFFLLSEHRLRFAGSQKAWTRRGWVVKSVEATDRGRGGLLRDRAGGACLHARRQHPHRDCFGCQANGDTISFVREVEHLDFVDAVERLASRAGITLRYDDKSVTKDKGRKARLYEAVAAAIGSTNSCSSSHPKRHRQSTCRPRLRRRDGPPVQARLVARRAGTRACAAAAPEVLRPRRHRRRRARVRQQGEQAAGRVPRCSCSRSTTEGEPVGFGGRALGGDGPKYKNSPETPIYQKSRLLYGLNWAKGEIVARGEVIICEGYTDVMAFVLAGAPTRSQRAAPRSPTTTSRHQEPRPQGVLAYDVRRRGRGRGRALVRVGAALRDPVRGRRPAGRSRSRRRVADDPAAARQAVERATPFLDSASSVCSRRRQSSARRRAGGRERGGDRSPSTRAISSATST